MSLNRRQFITTSSLAAAVGAIRPSWLFGQQAAQPTPTSFEQLRRNVGIFNGRGGTIGWLVNPNALVVVDSQFPDTAQACLDGLKQRSSRQMDALINSHHHGDHTGGNGVFRPLAKKIVAHSRVPELQRKQAAAANPPQDAVVPDTLFDTTWKEEFGDEIVSLKYYGPGHTGGDAVITFERANVVHMGDLMFNQRHPFVDRAAGASMKNWMDLLPKVTKDHSADTLYIFGHAKTDTPVTGSAKDLMAFHDYFDAVLTHVQKAVQAGKSKDEVTKLETLAKFEGYMNAPPRLTLGGVLGVAYDELTNAG